MSDRPRHPEIDLGAVRRELRRRAERASQGSWQFSMDSEFAKVNATPWNWNEEEPNHVVAHFVRRRDGAEDDAMYLAMLSPRVVLALLDALDSADPEHRRSER